MMNQGGSETDTLTTPEANSAEKYDVTDPSQPHTTSYYAPSVSSAISWPNQGANSYSRENGAIFNSSYHQDQLVDLTARIAQDGLNTTPVASTSSTGSANVPQDYSSYATYPSTDPYGYGNTGYAAYYSGYQQQPSQSFPQQPSQSYPQQPNQSYPQQPSQSYPQAVGPYQNSGAPYQPLSSFQNSGSASYSSTYYNPGDYQTSGGYQTSTYSNQDQTNYWNGGQYATYTSHQYPSYTPDTSTSYSATSAPATSQYGEQYKQWTDYYNQTQTEVNCAPGTENVSVPGASTISCPVPGVSSGYANATSSIQQQPAPYPQSWMPQSTLSELSSNQSGIVSSGVHDGYWKPGTASYPNQYSNCTQQHIQTPSETSSTYETFQNPQKSAAPQEFSLLYPTSHHVPQNYQSSFQPVTQTVSPLDSRKGNKLQIPTNPRIASNLPPSLSKTDMDTTASGATLKPAYIGVSLQKPNDRASSHDVATDSLLKPGMFPNSLRGYVERALARCKDDAQMAASQAAMKEIITKATADGTLSTRDWDIEPLFPLPNADMPNKEGLLLSAPTSGQKSKRSPGRRSKSRWEPLSEEKPDKPLSGTPEIVKFGGWNKQFTGGKSENKENHRSTPLADQKNFSRNFVRPAKKPRLGDGLNATDKADASSDSDKEQNLTAYYSAALALADNPEERKRRENRSKRFERGHGNRAETNHFRQRNAGARNLYTRRASALVLSKNIEDSGSKAVEDNDWDALTVKGTCQEIEKRYLRLTSAPDPATVRPAEVLEKALLMVQSSEKNYLYKCDQLKSIRQDLTVQRIRNELTAKVYETHARLAIEVGDLAEYNQCQSQLKTLYAEGIRGCHMEFAAYNLLCAILHSKNNRDLLSAMSRLSAEARKNDAVKHALAVRAAVTSGNYVLFFRLYKAAPDISTYLMDLYVEKMRYEAIKCMSRSYRPTVPVSYISQVLGFANGANDEKDADVVDECVEWLKAHGACLIEENSGEMLLDSKESMSTLFMPEPEDAVSHGDANLAVNDFLARNPSIS